MDPSNDEDASGREVPYTVFINIFLSLLAFVITTNVIPKFKDMFLKVHLGGVDMSKSTKCKLPEAQGVVSGAIYLIIMFLFIPIPFYEFLADRDTLRFPFHEYVEFLAALLSICCMIFLGFADDVLDLRWRHKLLLPTIASLPLLMVYFVTFDLTTIIVPKPFRMFFGYSVDIGLLYYVYMGMLAVFCTNAINIVAGINGIEVGQSIVIAISILVFNFIELNGEFREAHIFSMYFILPFLAVSLGLFVYNKYPSKVFVGDTYCYFAGMTFAVVAILGHFSKTMLLFMIPQVFNFLLSLPQLFRFVPCPRHRLPRYDAKTDLMNLSYSRFKHKELGVIGHLCIKLLRIVGLVKVHKKVGEDGEYMECSNMTIINVALRLLGPTNEGRLTFFLLVTQALCSCGALLIRYPLAKMVYERLQ